LGLYVYLRVCVSYEAVNISEYC